MKFQKVKWTFKWPFELTFRRYKLETIKTIPSNCDILINVVVTGNLSSLLATRERYEKCILKSRNARLSNIEEHNKCYELLPDFIKKVYC